MTRPIRVLVVDDEPLARRGITDLLAGQTGVELIGESRDGVQAVRDIEEKRPDLVFLDIQMPGLDGFEVLTQLDPAAMPAIIFVTAYDAHALRAFEVHAVDYILKPLDPDRFAVALERARALLRARDAGEPDRALETLLESLRREGRYTERFLVRSPGQITVVPVQMVDWIGADGDYATLHAGKQAHLIRETLQSLEMRLDPRRFVRIHRSHIVCLPKVRRVKTLETGDGIAVLEGGAELPVSRTYRERLLQALQQRG